MKSHVNYDYTWINETHYFQDLYQIYEFDHYTSSIDFNSLLGVEHIAICQEFMILKTNEKKINRHSTVAEYYRYGNGEAKFIDKDIQAIGCHYFVKDNLLFSIENDNKHRPISPTLNNSHSLVDIKVGITDWVYEEELFMISKAFKEYDKDVLFSVFDDTVVSNMPIVTDNVHDVYPIVTNWKYPRPGSPNPTNSLYFNYKSRNYLIYESDQDIVSDYIKYKDVIIFKVLNRVQNQLKYYSIDIEMLNQGTKKREIASFSAPWFEAQHSLSTNQDYFVDIINHILVIAKNKFEIIFTSGNLNQFDSDNSEFDANKIICFNDKRVVYLGTKDRKLGSMQQHLYMYDFNSKTNKILTKNYLLHFGIDEEEGYYDASAHSSCNSVILMYQGPKCQFESIYDFTSDTAKIIQNKNKDNLKDCPYTFIKNDYDYTIKYGDIKIQRQQLQLSNSSINVAILYPPTFRIGKQYPVVFNPYQGPDSQSVVFKETIINGFHLTLLLTDFVVVIADGAGTCCQGPVNKYKVNRNLGYHEAKDQLLLAKYISDKTWSYSDQICYFGWSYGGYLGLKIAQLDTNSLFKAIVSVAPVTDWLLYDTLYSERYMGMPMENINGYSASKVDPTNGFKQCLMIAHGTGDDNVHFQQSLHLLHDLFSHKKFDMRILPYPFVRHNMGQYIQHL